MYEKEDFYLTRLFYMAFLFFNQRLFNNELEVLFLQIRKRRTNRILGTYYCQPLINEHHIIHINKNFVYHNSLITLVHEMTHHWRDTCVQKRTKIHHDKQFREKMKSFGFVLPEEIPLANGPFFLAQNAFLHMLRDIASHTVLTTILGNFVCPQCGTHVVASREHRPTCSICHNPMPLYDLTLEQQTALTALPPDEHAFAAFCRHFLAKYTCSVRAF